MATEAPAAVVGDQEAVPAPAVGQLSAVDLSSIPRTLPDHAVVTTQEPVAESSDKSDETTGEVQAEEQPVEEKLAETPQPEVDPVTIKEGGPEKEAEPEKAAERAVSEKEAPEAAGTTPKEEPATEEKPADDTAVAEVAPPAEEKKLSVRYSCPTCNLGTANTPP